MFKTPYLIDLIKVLMSLKIVMALTFSANNVLATLLALFALIVAYPILSSLWVKGYDHDWFARYMYVTRRPGYSCKEHKKHHMKAFAWCAASLIALAIATSVGRHDPSICAFILVASYISIIVCAPLTSVTRRVKYHLLGILFVSLCLAWVIAFAIRKL